MDYPSLEPDISHLLNGLRTAGSQKEIAGIVLEFIKKKTANPATASELVSNMIQKLSVAMAAQNPDLKQIRGLEVQAIQLIQDLETMRGPRSPESERLQMTYANNAPSALFPSGWKLQTTIDPLLLSVGDMRPDLGKCLRELAILLVRLEKEPKPGYKQKAIELCEDFLKMLGVSVEEMPEPKAVIRSMGNRCYRIGEEQPVLLTETEDTVLQAFLKSPALEKRDLIRESGYNDAPRILAHIREKHKSFRPAISLPKRKGKGGYRVNIRAES
jgi:hypothetical protein